VPIDVVRATATPATGRPRWGLFGLDIANADGCQALATATASHAVAGAGWSCWWSAAGCEDRAAVVSAQIAVQVLDKPVRG